MEAARVAIAVRWHIGIDDDVRAGLIDYLKDSARRMASKRKVADVSPGEGQHEGEVPHRQPLVNVQQQS